MTLRHFLLHSTAVSAPPRMLLSIKDTSEAIAPTEDSAATLRATLDRLTAEGFSVMINDRARELLETGR